MSEPPSLEKDLCWETGPTGVGPQSTLRGTSSHQKDPVDQAERHREIYWEFSVWSNQIVGLQCCSDGLVRPQSGSEWKGDSVFRKVLWVVR